MPYARDWHTITKLPLMATGTHLIPPSFQLFGFAIQDDSSRYYSFLLVPYMCWTHTQYYHSKLLQLIITARYTATLWKHGSVPEDCVDMVFVPKPNGINEVTTCLCRNSKQLFSKSQLLGNCQSYCYICVHKWTSG